MSIAYPSRLRRIEQKIGLRAKSNLYWSCRKEKNFGDWIGPYIFEALSGRTAIHCTPTRLWRGHVNFTVGSILQWIKSPDMVDVWGSGIISADTKFARPRRVFAVRGPRSRARMVEQGYECGEVFGDPALLMPLLFSPQVEVTHLIGIVPHFEDFSKAKSLFKKMNNVKLIDVRSQPECVVREILACQIIMSSSLHGVIVAHAYGIPAVHILLSELLTGDGVKFLDYAEAFGPGYYLPTLNLTGSFAPTDAVAFAQHNAVHFEPKNLQKDLLESCPFLTPDIRTSLFSIQKT